MRNATPCNRAVRKRKYVIGNNAVVNDYLRHNGLICMSVSLARGTVVKFGSSILTMLCWN